jgi:hypothetical protein
MSNRITNHRLVVFGLDQRQIPKAKDQRTNKKHHTWRLHVVVQHKMPFRGDKRTLLLLTKCGDGASCVKNAVKLINAMARRQHHPPKKRFRRVTGFVPNRRTNPPAQAAIGSRHWWVGVYHTRQSMVHGTFVLVDDDVRVLSLACYVLCGRIH